MNTFNKMDRETIYFKTKILLLLVLSEFQENTMENDLKGQG